MIEFIPSEKTIVLTVNDVKKWIEVYKKFNEPPTLAASDDRNLRSYAHWHKRLFESYSKEERNLIINFLIKQHNNCKNGFRQTLYYEDLCDFGLEVERKAIGMGRVSDKIYKITNVRWRDTK